MSSQSSPRVTLQKIEKKDVETLYSLVQRHPQITQYLRWTVPSSVPEMMERFDTLEQKEARGERRRFGIFYEDTLIGSVSLTNIVRDSGRRRMNAGELGYWISPDFGGKGYALDAAKQMIQYGFETLGLHKITAACVAENQASKKLLQKLNMRHIGTSQENFWLDDRWWDMELYEIIKPGF